LAQGLLVSVKSKLLLSAPFIYPGLTCRHLSSLGLLRASYPFLTLPDIMLLEEIALNVITAINATIVQPASVHGVAGGALAGAAGAGLPAGDIARADVSFANALVQAFCMVSVAEVFDKTWFMAIIMAMTFGKQVSFWASTLALQAHVVIAAVFGYALAKVMPPTTLLLLASCLYFVFFVMYAWDCLQAERDSDIFSSGMEDSREDAGVEEQTEERPSYGAADSAGPAKKGLQKKNSWNGFWKTFVAVFIAEWGDRTQIAMIGQHASLPIIPVVIGSAIAFTLLTGSAVVVSGFVDQLKISEKHVNCLAAGSFLLFFVLTAREACHEMGQDPLSMVMHR